MTPWLRWRPRGLVTFLIIAGLVIGGLGWVTAAALRLEREQAEARIQVARDARLRLALWRLDSRLAAAFAREESRPFSHYSAVSAPSLAFSRQGQAWPAGTVLEVSPLLEVELPQWMLLHFQADPESGWTSPQVLSETLRQRLSSPAVGAKLANATPERSSLLEQLAKGGVAPASLLAEVGRRPDRPAIRDTALVLSNAVRDVSQSQAANAPAQQGLGGYEYQNRSDQRARVNREASNSVQLNDSVISQDNLRRNGENWFQNSSGQRRQGVPVPVTQGALVPLWFEPERGPRRLLAIRVVRIGAKDVCQGILLDWPALQSLLVTEVVDLFPDARLAPVQDGDAALPERTMTALPAQLDPGDEAVVAPETEWTTLRFGLVLAWAAALAALIAVGLGGWSLLDLAERRIRFVSAVTHELRTPLTTLRLYLDMLTGGLVRDERQKDEYLHTLNAETDRLNRLVANVLDFSRLEDQRPRLNREVVSPAALMDTVRTMWEGRCHDTGKELVVDNACPADLALATDAGLVQQIIGNLIDNACKYTRGAADPRLWLRAGVQHGRLLMEVEDRGPGVAKRERRSIFRPFRRGREADVTAGGVGLGLALATRWASLLGGRLEVRSGDGGVGACFRLEVPLDA